MRLVFVCMENVMESVVAECLFSKRAQEVLGEESRLFEVESCGLEAGSGAEVRPGCSEVLGDMGIPVESMQATPASEENLETADLVITMNRHQRVQIAQSFPDIADRCFALMEANGAIEGILEGRGISAGDPEWVRFILNSSFSAVREVLESAVAILRDLDRMTSRPLSGVPLTLRELIVDFADCYHHISGLDSPLEGTEKEIGRWVRRMDDEVTELLRGLIALAASEGLEHTPVA